jgi:N-methyl-L-proline demethylase
MSADPLLQPLRLKHLTLRNRILITAHEPSYAQDGMPKARYRAYHVERAKAGVALTMTAGSATVSRDSPPAFNNLLAYEDAIVPWLRDLADACHEHGAAVMIQLTHLGRRTRWDKADWLPVVSSSHRREAAHRAFPKQIEDWDIERIVKDYADAAERMRAAGLDGIEVEAYGHLMDQFWSPLTNTLEGAYGGTLENRMRFSMEVLAAIRKRVGAEFIVGVRYTADEVLAGGLTKADGLEISQRLKSSGLVDFVNIIRGHVDTDAGLTDVIPIQGMPSAPHLDFAGEIRAATHCRRQGGHGRHDASAYCRSAPGAQDRRRPRGRYSPVRRGQLLPRPDLSERLGLLHSQRSIRARAHDAAFDTSSRGQAEVRGGRGGPRRTGGGARRGGARS